MAIKPFLPNFLKNLKRGPAIVSPKDAGLIIAYSGVNKGSKVVEVGTGAGFLTIQLARVAKEIITYEKNPEFAGVAKENFKKANLENITLKVQDAFEGIPERDLELVVVDIPNAHEIVPMVEGCIVNGGYFVGHCLSIEQSKLLFLACARYFSDIIMVENPVREYEVSEQRVRPKHIGIVHTAYLIFAKKSDMS